MDDNYTNNNTDIIIGVQVNGKLRGSITVKTSATDEEIRVLALALPNVIEVIKNHPTRNIIIIPKKVVNILV